MAREHSVSASDEHLTADTEVTAGENHVAAAAVVVRPASPNGPGSPGSGRSPRATAGARGSSQLRTCISTLYRASNS